MCRKQLCGCNNLYVAHLVQMFENLAENLAEHRVLELVLEVS